jgi:DNA-directed RNA polymerase specialized sigma subunit
MWDWADFVRDGRTCQGVFSTSMWPEGRPVESRRTPASRRKQKPLVTAHVPHETRASRSKIPCMRVAYREERVHKIVVNLPECVKPIICLLYLQKMGYGDVALVMGMKSKQVVRIKRKSLKYINDML